MSNLVPIGQDALAQGGVGFGSKLFDLKPSTIQIVQRMTRAEGAIPGKLRVAETGDHYDEMQVVMLTTPIQQRSYFAGEEFNKDSKLCFSTNAIEPHKFAKVPQAMKCAGCALASWETYRKTKNRADLPKCKEYWHTVLADRVTQLPYYLNIKSTSIKPFETAMGQVAKLVALMKAKAKAENKPLPNIYDVSFKIFTKLNDDKSTYILAFKDFAPLKEEDRADFGALFLDFANRKAKAADADLEGADGEEQAAAAGAAPADQAAPPTIDAPAAPIQGEIVI